MASTQVIPALHARIAAAEVEGAGGLYTAAEALSRFRLARHEPERGLRVVGLSTAQLERPDELQAARNLLLNWADDPRNNRLVIDFETINTIPSTLYALLHTLAKRCQQSGGSLRLSGVSPEIRKTLATLRLDRLIPCFADVDHATA